MSGVPDVAPRRAPLFRSRFAWYMASSACCCTSSSRVPWSGATPVPVLTRTSRVMPASSIGASTTALIRCATSMIGGDCSWSVPRSTSTANSSPPRRAARSPERIAVCRRRPTSISRLVARGVTQGVVDVLEAVEVQQHDCEPVSCRRARRPRPRPLAEVQSVRQAGQRVVQRLVRTPLGLGAAGTDQSRPAVHRRVPRAPPGSRRRGGPPRRRSARHQSGHRRSAGVGRRASSRSSDDDTVASTRGSQVRRPPDRESPRACRHAPGGRSASSSIAATASARPA